MNFLATRDGIKSFLFPRSFFLYILSRGKGGRATRVSAAERRSACLRVSFLCVSALVHMVTLPRSSSDNLQGGGLVVGGALQVAVLSASPPLWRKLRSEEMNLSFDLLYF